MAELGSGITSGPREAMAQPQDVPQAFPAAEQANVDPIGIDVLLCHACLAVPINSMESHLLPSWPAVFQTAQPLTNNEVQLLLSKWGAQCRDADPTWVESPGVKDVQKYLTAVSGSTGANLIPEVFGRIRQ